MKRKIPARSESVKSRKRTTPKACDQRKFTSIDTPVKKKTHQTEKTEKPPIKANETPVIKEMASAPNSNVIPKKIVEEFVNQTMEIYKKFYDEIIDEGKAISKRISEIEKQVVVLQGGKYRYL